MANAPAVCSSFKQELLNGKHAFGVPPVRASAVADVFKAALFTSAGSIGASTTSYSTANEASGTGYNAGGVTVANANVPGLTGSVAFWTPSGSFAWPTVTLTSVDCALLYNSTQGGAACAAYTFGAQSVTAANFTLTMPSNDSANALLRLL